MSAVLDTDPAPVVHDYRAPKLRLEEALLVGELAEQRTVLRDKLLAIAECLHQRPSWHLESVLFELTARQLDFRPATVGHALCELINARNWAYGAYRKNPDSRDIAEIRDLVQETDKLFGTFLRDVFARCS